MSNLEERLRALLAARASDAPASPAELPRATWRRAIARQALSAVAAFTLVATGTGIAFTMRTDGGKPIGPPPAASEPAVPSSPTDSAATAATESAAPSGASNTTRASAAPAACTPAAARSDGIDESKILLGATIVQSGIGGFHLRDADAAMRGAVEAVNAAGGVCGRTIQLKLVDDGWDAQRGLAEIRKLVEQDRVAALAVVPSTEGLLAAANITYFSKQGIAAAGTLGTHTAEFNEPSVFPVGVSPASSGRILARYAWSRGARHAAVVYDSRTRSGVEQAMAFDGEITALQREAGTPATGVDGYGDTRVSGGCSARACALEPGRPSYASEANTLYQNCARPPKCDFVAVFLDPSAAAVWMGATNGQTILHGGTQMLMTGGFPKNCGERCANFTVLTPYEPPVGALRNLPAVAAYARTMQSVRPAADATNPYTEGAYAGMQVLIEALRRAGPTPTRLSIAEALRSAAFDVGLTQPLRWRPGRSEANRSMRPLRTVVVAGGFTGWRLDGDRVTDR